MRNLKIIYPIVVVVVGFALSYVFSVWKLRGVLEFFCVLPYYYFDDYSGQKNIP